VHTGERVGILVVEVVAVEGIGDEVVLPVDAGGVVDVVEEVVVRGDRVGGGRRGDIGDGLDVVARGVAAREGLPVEDEDARARPVAAGEAGGGHARDTRAGGGRG